MPPTRRLSLSTRRSIVAGLMALVGLVALLLTPTASDAAPLKARRTTTTTTVRRTTTTTVVRTTTTALTQADAADDVPTFAADDIPTLDSAPAAELDALAAPTITLPTFPVITFPDLGAILQNVLLRIQAIFVRVNALLCALFGGTFCASP